MQKLEVLIEEGAYGSVRPVEVAADAPVAALVPALVEELNLPQTDLFGKQLVYMLRRSDGGRILSENTTLLASGIEPGARLALDSYVLDGSVATPTRGAAQPYVDSTLHSSMTIADHTLMPALGSGSYTGGYALVQPQKKERKWARRTFLLMSGAVLGMGGAGLGYAAYNGLLTGVLNFGNGAAMLSNTTNTTTKTTVATKPAFPTTAKALHSFRRHQQIVRTVAWSSDGMLLASGSDDTHILVWNTNGTVRSDINLAASVRSVAWAPDGKRLAAGVGTQVLFFNALTGTSLARAVRRHNGNVVSVAWSAHNQMQVVSGGADMQAAVWSTANYRPLISFRLHTSPIDVVSWAADGQTVASASQGGVVRVWNAASGKELHGFYQDAQMPMRALAFAPTGMLLAVGGDDGKVRLWNGLTCQQQGNIGNGVLQCMDVPTRIQVGQKAVRSLAWSPDGRMFAAGTEDGILSLWNPQQAQAPLLKVQQNDAIRSITWSPDGKQVASASGNVVTLWGLM